MGEQLNHPVFLCTFVKYNANVYMKYVV